MISKRHPHRGLAPSGKLEWKIPGSRRWRFCRLHRLRPSRDFDPWRLCLSEHKHRPRRGSPHRRFLGARPSRKTHRLRLPRRPSDDCSRQRCHPRPLRQSAAVFLLSRLLQRRPPGLDGKRSASPKISKVFSPERPRISGRISSPAGCGTCRRWAWTMPATFPRANCPRSRKR